MAKAVVAANCVPPVKAAYHFNAVPVAVKFATVALLQNDCAEAVGDAVTFIITATAVRVLSQLFSV